VTSLGVHNVTTKLLYWYPSSTRRSDTMKIMCAFLASPCLLYVVYDQKENDLRCSLLCNFPTSLLYHPLDTKFRPARCNLAIPGHLSTYLTFLSYKFTPLSVLESRCLELGDVRAGFPRFSAPGGSAVPRRGEEAESESNGLCPTKHVSVVHS